MGRSKDLPMPSQPLTPGALVGRYEVIAHLASGGMGEVYKARDVELELGATPRSCGRAHATAMGVSDRLRDRQTKSSAAASAVTSAVSPVETVEHTLELLTQSKGRLGQRKRKAFEITQRHNLAACERVRW